MFSIPLLTLDFYKTSAPIFILIIGSLISLLQSVSPWKSARYCFLFTMIVLVSSFLSLFTNPSLGVYLSGSFVFDGLSYFSQIAVLLISIFVVTLFHGSYLREKFFRPEITTLFQMVVMGMLIAVSSYDFVTIIVGLELSSLGIYALIGYIDPTQKSQEAAMKYLIMGSFATAFLLFGMALIYACYGVFQLDELAKQSSSHPPVWALLGAVFLICGFAFKLALVPFHSWAPDAYEGAPTGLTAFMSTAVKIVILTLFFRLSQFAFQEFHVQWFNVIYSVCIFSLLFGNIFALVQTSIKRMLAYSSIAHSGYMAIALSSLAFSTEAFTAQTVLFYLVGYILASILAFSVLSWLETEHASNIQLEDLRGLAKKHPWASFALTCALFSFSGFPPTVGFLAKLLVFKAAITTSLWVPVFAGVVASVIGLYYYLRVVVYMYFYEAKDSISLPQRQQSGFVIFFATLALCLVLVSGVFPNKILDHLQRVFTKVETVQNEKAQP